MSQRQESIFPGDERESEEKYRSLFEQSRDAIYITSLDGRFLDVNQSALDLLGYKREDMARIAVPQVYADPAERKKFQSEIEKKGSVNNYEVKLRRRDGTIIDCLLSSTIRRAKDGAVLGYQGIIHDITSRKRIEDRLRDSEDKLRVMFESIEEGVIVFGLDGRVTQVNNAALGMFGFANKDEAIGSRAIDLIAPKDRGRAGEVEQQVLSHGYTRSGEYTCLRRGEEFEAELSIARLCDRAGSPAGFVVVCRDITERKRLAANMQYYISEITRAQEEERSRIARELHDEIVQELVALALEVESMTRERAGLPPVTRRRLTGVWEKMQGVMKELRRFSAELRPDIIDRLGLIPAIEFLTEELNREGKLKGRLEVNGEPRRLTSEAELGLFRIVQEALRNIRKHAGANQVLAKIEFTGNLVRLAITDDGRGFEPPETLSDLATRGRLGLIGMQERARLLGGSFSINSAPGKGTAIEVELSA